jgi:uncharacterized protein YciI
MFIISLSYKKEISDVEKFIEPHTEFLNKYYSEKKFIFSGRKNPRTGGVILARNLDKKTLQEIIKQDPFYQNHIADYEITEVIPTKYDEGFARFIEIE